MPVFRDKNQWLNTYFSLFFSRTQVTLQCQPPKGYPEPSVSWTKDGDPMENEIKTTERIRLNGGNLEVSLTRGNV